MSGKVPLNRNSEDKGPMALDVVISMSVLSALFTAGRLFVRGKILKHFHLDDYLIVASVVCGWTNVGTAIAVVAHGNGRHFDVLTLEQKSGAILWTIAGFPPGVMSFGLPKLAVVALLTRIMKPSRWHALFLWFIATFCLINLIGCDFSVTDKTCWYKWILVYFAIYSGGFCALVDLYLAIYPAVVLAKLQMSIRKKVALSIALGIGSIVEGSTMIIAACIPVLQPLGELIFGKRIFSSGGGRYTYENYGSGPSGQYRSDIEMSRSKEATKRVARRQHSANAISFDDTVSTTMVTRGSQESILQGRNVGRDIVRTDVISVSIESSKS
ncbi:integral membrane protein [Colletotrichum acutatum]